MGGIRKPSTAKKKTAAWTSTLLNLQKNSKKRVQIKAPRPAAEKTEKNSKESNRACSEAPHEEASMEAHEQKKTSSKGLSREPPEGN